MHPDIKKLLAVQQVDARLARIRRDLDSLPAEEQRRSRQLEIVRQEHATAKAELSAAQVRSRESEVNIKGADEEIKKLQGRLNVVKNNAEYQATLFQIESVRRERDAIEEEGLAVLDQLDAMKARVEEAEQKLAAEQKTFDEFRAEADKMRGELETQLSEVGRGRDELVEGVPTDLVRKYQSLFETRGGKAVCSVEGEVCTGCYSRVTPNDQTRLLGSSIVVQCNSCQRLLYLPES